MRQLAFYSSARDNQICLTFDQFYHLFLLLSHQFSKVDLPYVATVGAVDAGLVAIHLNDFNY